MTDYPLSQLDLLVTGVIAILEEVKSILGLCFSFVLVFFTIFAYFLFEISRNRPLVAHSAQHRGHRSVNSACPHCGNWKMPSPAVVDSETPVGLPLSARFKQSFAHFSMTSRNPDIIQSTIDSPRENPPGGADVETLCRDMPSPAVVDSETPVGLPLSAHFKQSFAHFSMNSRNPDIIQRTIDSLRENPPGGADVETLCRDLEQLLEEVRADATWAQLTSSAPDAGQWNRLLRAAGCACSRHWLTAPWIVAESYMYRRIRQAAEAAPLADPKNPPDTFLPVKQKAIASGMPAIQALAEWMSEAGSSRADLNRLLKTATFANAGDLSLSAGVVPDPDHLTAITATSDEAFVADQSETVWTVMQSGLGCVTVDVVCDNVGYELFADLCLAQMLTSLGATRMRFHLKVDQPPPEGCQASHSYCGLNDRKYPDCQSMGYPFDRLPRSGVSTLKDFLTPNMRVLDVVIKHHQITTSSRPLTRDQWEKFVAAARLKYKKYLNL